MGACLPTDTLNVTEKTGKETIRNFITKDKSPSFGYLSYTYGLILKNVKTTKQEELPIGILKKYALYFSYSPNNETLQWKAPDSQKYVRILETFFTQNTKPLHPNKPQPKSLKTSLSREDYISRVEKVIKHIQEGDTYQLNLSIEYQSTLKATSSELFHLFLELFQKYPASHYAYFNLDPYTLISTSPESFLTVQGKMIASSPIKGTAKISDDNEAMKRKILISSPKEDAELSMIVDLIRNDIAYHCEPGSIQVKNHKSIFRVDNLLQMYSTVQGRLLPASDALDALLDAFPGGSITGVPKRKAMHIIDKLEPHSRNIYCGSFVLFYDIDHMDSSIAIRTAFHNKNNNTFKFYAGSGITADSLAQSEYEETSAKAEKFLSLLT